MINLHENQTEPFAELFVDRTKRFSVVNCSRGFGKSYLAGACATAAVFELLALSHKVPNKYVYIIAPTYGDVTDIYYPMLAYDFGLEQYALRCSRDTGRFLFPNKVELRLLSYEAVERIRGKGAYFIAWDEISACKKGIKPKAAWESVIRPAMVTRWSAQRAKLYGAVSASRALFIGTPEGYNFFHELSTYSESKPDEWAYHHYGYKQSPFIDPEEIELLRDETDPITFAREYDATFKESGNLVFYCFDRKKHLDANLPYFTPANGSDRGEDVHLSIDFNVNLQCTGAFAIRGKQMHFLDEFKGHPDTEQLAIALATKYKGHRLFAYPDPSGRSRKTSAIGVTDFSILQSHGIQCNAHQAAPSMVDSVAAVNKKLMTANGAVDLFIHPRCKGITASLERTKWVDNNPDTATIDKSESIEHYSDGIRYASEFLFPILSGKTTVARGFKF